MMYLIGQLAVWLLLTAAFAGVAGWAFAAQRAAPEEQSLRRERAHLLRDIARIAGGETIVDASANERELDALRRQIEVRDGRIAELERGIEAARARADEGASRIAELERAPRLTAAEHEEVARLRAMVAQHEEDRSREVEVTAEPVEESQEAALQGWRLRYFEQRVRYLEGLAAQSPVAAPAEEAAPVEHWRAREAEARAAFLDTELRKATAPQQAEDAEAQSLLGWRLRYLERRVQHLQEQAVQPVAALSVAPPAAASEPDADRWKWRARYLEARIRHLEQRAPAPQAEAQPVAEAPPPQAPPVEAPAVRPQRPSTLPAPRNGAADDFTLIEDVSVLQQTTLYSLGVFHFDQIAAWTPAHVAWVDQYLRLRGRIDAEEWVAQARALADRGVRATRRVREEAGA